MVSSSPETSMANDVLYALSMYFAAALNTHLLSYREDAWTLLLLGGVFAVQLKIHRAWTSWSVHQPSPSLFRSVLDEADRLVTRTVAFLLLHVTIHMVTGHAHGATGLWHETVVLPCLLLLLGMVVVTVAKTYRHQQQQ